jgi:hypothetical protein
MTFIAMIFMEMTFVKNTDMEMTCIKIKHIYIRVYIYRNYISSWDKGR